MLGRGYQGGEKGSNEGSKHGLVLGCCETPGAFSVSQATNPTQQNNIVWVATDEAPQECI